MIKIILISLFATLVIVAGIYIYVVPIDKIVMFYGDKLRGNLFAGFLTLGGFLFSLKTFIVIKMKENVYDHAEYKRNLDEKKRLNPNLTLYGPLQRLSNLLFFSVLFSIITAVLQLSLGLVENWHAVLVCLATAIFTLIILVISLFLIKSNLDQWFGFLENNE